MHFTLNDPPFYGRTGRHVVVAVLDSGIHGDHDHVGGVQGGISFVDGAETDTLDRIGHGTAVAAAIREKSPDAALLAVRVFARQLATNVDILARAIVWSADNGAALINLSLGTANAANAERLATAVNYAAERGSVVVSADAANDVTWFPGSLLSVAAVSPDWECDRESLTVAARPGGLPKFVASPYPRPIPGVPRERNLTGVSFAVANVTGFLARAIEDAPDGAFQTLTRLAERAS